MLCDYIIPRFLLNDVFNARYLVSGQDDKIIPLFVDLLIILDIDDHPLAASLIGALAEKVHRSIARLNSEFRLVILLSQLIGLIIAVMNLLVQLPEHNFIFSQSPLRRCILHTTTVRPFSTVRGNNNYIKYRWWGCLDLNQGPIGYEPTALTTELHPREWPPKVS